MKRWKLTFIFAFVIVMGILAACGANKTVDRSSNKEEPEEVVIGYFPNIDHVPAMVAREKGYFEQALGDDYKIEYKIFPDGGTFMAALKSGDIDGGLVGPAPVMNNYASGADVKIVSGASSGGTVVVASEKSGINSLEEVEGKTFITPGIGCTHNVQFEAYLQEQGIEKLASSRIGGTLQHVTGNPAQYEGMFETGKVDLAAVPEPWASILTGKGAKIIVSTDEIAYGHTLPNTVFVVNGNLIREKEEVVKALVEAQKKAIHFIKSEPEQALDIAVASIKTLTKQELDKKIAKQAMERINYTTEIDENVIEEFAQSSFELNFLKEQPKLDGLVDLSFQ